MNTALVDFPPASSPYALASYDYDLPPELIAQEPVAERDAARLMVLDGASREPAHRFVRDLAHLFSAGDLVVVNDTRVRPARLRGHTETGAAFEILLLRRDADGRWECLAKPSKRLRIGRHLVFADGCGGVVIGEDAGRVVIAFDAAVSVEDLLERVGEVPLPPYIHRPEGIHAQDRERYQTVFARVPGAVAAPTAGLHLTESLLAGWRANGVKIASLTLHVGPGTFLPVRAADVREHTMDPEWADVPSATADAVAEAKAGGHRVIAIGTTTTRALESRSVHGSLQAGEGWADAFIVPGFEFQVVDAMLTNFHLPRSTLLMLVSAFAGRETVLAAYRRAVEARYRFYSYGDAMFVSRLSGRPRG